VQTTYFVTDCKKILASFLQNFLVKFAFFNPKYGPGKYQLKFMKLSKNYFSRGRTLLGYSRENIKKFFKTWGI